MDDQTRHPREDADIDAGEPIAELASLREEPADGFAPRIRNSIQRRLFAAHAADFSLRVLLQTFFDYLTAALDAFGLQEPRNDKGDEDE